MDMDWYRRPELKRRAKNSLRHNYWKCIVVALLLFLLLPSNDNIRNNKTNSYDSYSYNSTSYNNRTSQIISTYTTLSTHPQTHIFRYSCIALVNCIEFILRYSHNATINNIIGLMLIFSILFIYLFIIPLLQVGCYDFFLENAKSGNAGIRQVFHPFKNNFETAALTMFLKNLFLSLWFLLGVVVPYAIFLFSNSLLALPCFLLLVLPIMKFYEYRMIPYILADRPDLKRKEVFEQTKLLMKDQKMRLFLLDLSFLGWNILSALTLYIAGYFYVNPYRYATEAEFYLDLKREWEERLSP
ncbi:MAG: DUF975 family protein [Acetatifactor sp.]|nr:DUF975 family protein [Acetatifactor sp.]MDE7114545.1 DUF975 family protein [Acetatifactor sp.]